MRFRTGLGMMLLALILSVLPRLTPPVEAQQDLVSLAVNAGFDGYFRENYWVPLLISVTNNGDPIDGSLIARQERSNGLTNTFSTPVSLANGARQTVFLYVTLNSFATNLVLELIDSEGVIITDLNVPVRPVQPRDELYVVLSGSTSASLDLSGLNIGGNQSFQANWFPVNIPDHAPALDAVSMILFNEVDTGTLTAAQRTAIRNWISNGGHLVITGGPNWQPTAAAFTDLLPLQPAETINVSGIAPLLELAGDYTTRFTGDITISRGTVTPDADVLARSADGQPLLARRASGYGTVDYLALNPELAPFRTWSGQNDFWYTVLSSVDTHPAWSYGFHNVDRGIDAVEILPGYTALPEVTAMVSFLVLYIVLVGPVNYLILNRLNRRELAWITIPLLILTFSAVAWATGFNLRGNEVLLSRLTVMQSWADQPTARTDQFIGLLAPRRASYTLAVDDDRLLRPVTRASQPGRLFGNSGGALEIEQDSVFTALDFPVDASFVGAFAASGYTPAPAISGQAVISFVEDGDRQAIRGTIRNDSELTLTDPVLLARGQVFRLDEPLAPGDLVIFGNEIPIWLENDGAASPSPLEHTRGTVYDTPSRFYVPGYSRTVVSLQQSMIDILSPAVYNGNDIFMPGLATTTLNGDPEQERRQRFMDAFMADQYYATSRGNQAYLAGWTSSAPLTETVTGAGWRAVDSTLHLIKLETSVEQPEASRSVVITPDQFTWAALEREGVLDAAPTNLTLYSDRVVGFRFTPLADARLSRVTGLTLVIDQGDVGNNVRRLDIELWDWRNQVWELFEIDDLRTPIADPARFIGPLNAVQARLNRDISGGYLYLARMSFEQTGTF